jgi:ankyrin repeat protein
MSQLTNDLCSALSRGDAVAVARLLAGQCADELMVFPEVPALVYACDVMDLPVACLDAVLERTRDVNMADSRGVTGLMNAAMRGDRSLVSRMLERGANPNARDREGRSALHLGLLPANPAPDLLTLLLDAGANQAATDTRGDTPLHIAARGGHLPAIRILLEHGARPDVSAATGRRPLHEAGANGRDGACRLLVEYGAPVDSPDRQGWTPFLAAVGAWKYSAARVLLECGADVNAQLGNEAPMMGGLTALMLALGDFDGWLLDERSPGRDFDAEFLNLMISSGADLNAQAADGRTALHLAGVESRNLLFTHGADPNIADQYGMTPLHYAAKYGSTEFCADLCGHGALLERTDKIGFTPLALAASSAFPETVRELIRLGANLEHRMPDGMMALHLAARTVQRERMVPTLRVLIEAGARAELTDTGGFTVLHHAAISGVPEAIELLLACGADKRVRSAGGQTALDLARRFGHDDVACLLTD